MEVVTIEPSKVSEWNAYVDSHPQASIYHRDEWRAVTEGTFGFQPMYLAVKSERGIEGLLPGFLLRQRRYISMPLRDRGGILVNSPEAVSVLLGYLGGLLRSGILKSIELKADVSLPQIIAREHILSRYSSWVKVERPLPGDVSLLHRELRGTPVWRAVQKSFRSGVDVITADRPPEWDRFYEMFLETRQRLGVPPYPFKLFSLIREKLAPLGFAKLFIARKDGKDIAGMIFLNFNRTFIYAYGAARECFLEFRPNDRLIFHAMCWAIENRVEKFDFGADPPSQESLLRFKRKWGGRQKAVIDYYSGVPVIPWRHYETTLFRAGRFILRRLPSRLYRRTSWLPKHLAY